MELLEKFMVELQPLIINAVIVIVGALLGFLTRKIKEFLDVRIDANVQQQIHYVVTQAVLAVDEIAPHLKIKGEEKYKKAVEMATVELARYGVITSEEELYYMIHGILQEMRKGW